MDRADISEECLLGFHVLLKRFFVYDIIKSISVVKLLAPISYYFHRIPNYVMHGASPLQARSKFVQRIKYCHFLVMCSASHTSIGFM